MQPMDRYAAVYDCGFQVSLERLILAKIGAIRQTPSLLQKEPGSRDRVPSNPSLIAHRPNILRHHGLCTGSCASATPRSWNGAQQKPSPMSAGHGADSGEKSPSTGTADNTSPSWRRPPGHGPDGQESESATRATNPATHGRRQLVNEEENMTEHPELRATIFGQVLAELLEARDLPVTPSATA